MMLSKKLPIFPLESLVFPGGLLALRIFETRYIDMVRECMRKKTSFVITANQRLEDTNNIAQPHNIGTRVEIIDFEQLSDGLLGITVHGQHKVDIKDISPQSDKLLIGKTHKTPEDSQESIPEDFALLSDVLKQMFPEIQTHYGDSAKQYLIENYQDASWVSSRLVEVLPMDIQMKIELLRMEDAGERVRVIYEALERMQVI